MQTGGTRRGPGALGFLLGAGVEEEGAGPSQLLPGQTIRIASGNSGGAGGLVPQARIVGSLSALLLLALVLTLVNPPSPLQASTPAGGDAAMTLGTLAKTAAEAGGEAGAAIGGSKAEEESREGPAAEAPGSSSSSVAGSAAEAAGEGPDPSRPSRCTAGCAQGTCNEELGECFCHVPYGGPNCSAPAFPACHLAPGYWTPCWMRTTCECQQQCHALRLAGEDQCYRGRYPDGSPITNLTEIFSGSRYLVPWNREHTLVRDPTYEEAPFDNSTSSLDNPRECPDMCSGHGVCSREHRVCQCPWAAHGAACQESMGLAGHGQGTCLSGCSGRGSCHCQRGFFGIDCSLLLDSRNKTRILPRRPYDWTQAVPPQHQPGDPRPRPLVYVYDLPGYFNTWQGLQSPGMDWPESVHFLERLLGSAHRTADPGEADFFYLPLLIRNRRLQKENVVQLAVDYVRAKYPFYGRSNGTDHIVLTNEDWGSCQLDGPSGRGFLPPLLDPLIVLTVWAHTLNMVMETERPCFREGQDVAIPPMMDRGVYRLAPNFPLETAEEGGEAERKVLLYFCGSSYAEDACEGPGRFCRSLGARQSLFRHYAGRFNATGVLLETANVLNQDEFLGSFLRSRFCFAPAGFGWAMRTTQAAIMGCIPVVVQPHVVQPFQGDGLNWDDFAVILSLEDVPRLHQILGDMPEAEVRRKREGCFRVRSRFVWSSYSANPLEFLPQEKQDRYAPALLKGDMFAGVMEALRLRLKQA